MSNADLWLCLGSFFFLFFLVSCWFPFPCMPPAHARSPPLRLLPSLLCLLRPDQTASSDRRGAWEVQPNRQANSYLTSHLASDRHGGSVQVSLPLLHPSISQSHSPFLIILLPHQRDLSAWTCLSLFFIRIPKLVKWSKVTCSHNVFPSGKEEGLQ